MNNLNSDIDTGLISFALIAQYYEKPISIEQIQHKYDRQNQHFNDNDLLKLAKEFSLKAKFTKSTWEKLSLTPLPAIAKDKDGKYFILAQVSEDKVLIQDPIIKKPTIVSKEDFLAKWSEELLLVTSREFIAGKNRKFDISWFITAIVKYRKLFSEVLLSSLFLQLFALISPLLFQVIIDKVLVHRGLSSNDKEVLLKPGMSVTAEIKTGKRRVIEYILSLLSSNT